MKLYHGSKSGIAGKINPYKSRTTCDFGKGFYLGDMPDQPKGLIASREYGKYYEIEYDISSLKILEFKEIYQEQLDWALFIAYNRNPALFEDYNILKQKYAAYNTSYDVIIGLIADDSMMNTLNRFFAGESTDKVMIDCLKHVKLGNQYVLKTEEACKSDRVKIITERELEPYEKKAAQADSAQRLRQMDSIINMYSKKYRRDTKAKYIDEIMEEWNK
ncbi:MAG: DUF3990 domain-containing protein [Lachnospiraceae bacterium]|nr:DUF3990 domain-containing protein [Lachnospiraceae bacterium]